MGPPSYKVTRNVLGIVMSISSGGWTLTMGVFVIKPVTGVTSGGRCVGHTVVGVYVPHHAVVLHMSRLAKQRQTV